MRRALLVCTVLLASCVNRVGEPAKPTIGAGEPAPIVAGRAPGPSEYPQPFDALHYTIRLSLAPTGNRITGSTDIRLAVSRNALAAFLPVGAQRPDTVPLDFTGLEITDVQVDGARVRGRHENGKLFVPLPAGAATGQELRIRVDYAGIPDDGLIIRKNVHGAMAAFADNWPNRARFWFPAIDHPADKATASFIVDAPAAWSVIANGSLVQDDRATSTGNPAGQRRWTWEIREPISTYNMVVGAASFDRRVVGNVCVPEPRCIEVTTYLFPEDSDKGAAQFRRAAQMVEYYSGLIAPYPYGKLAHVQSSTRFGGMENATAIFYDEQSITKGRDIEALVAHETAHQWFGDAVTPADWPHVWLSEGFATYFANLFVEHADGVERLRQRMEADRARIVRSDASDRPVVGALPQDLFELLDTNAYQKGGWVLHMLRGLVGDPVFFDGIRRYYRSHEHETATTEDLQQAMEQASGQRLGWFFEQWLLRPGFPRLRVASRWDSGARAVAVTIEQTQRSSWPTFRLPLIIALDFDGSLERHAVDLDERRETFRIRADVAPRRVTVDPDGWLLKEMDSQPATARP